MEIEKPRKEMEDDDNYDGVGRSYECSYCKRGFTNAQALGGHMNIHRKDKAKAKAKPKNYPTPTFSSYSSVSYKNDHSNDQALAYSPALKLAPQRNYQAHNYNYNYPSANNNPRSLSTSSSNPPVYFGNENFAIGRSGLFGMYEEPLGADLSLRGTHEEISKKKKDNESNYDVIDLELRLGYDR